jgi:hypothetical protein
MYLALVNIGDVSKPLIIDRQRRSMCVGNVDMPRIGSILETPKEYSDTRAHEFKDGSEKRLFLLT